MNYKEASHRLNLQKETLSQIRSFFEERGFQEIPFVPLITRHPGQEPNLDPVEVDLNLAHPARTVRAGLITSPEYAMKRLIASGLEKIYTITPVFRNTEQAGGNHGPEFLMLEWYAPGGYQDLMQETEELLNTVLGESRSWPRIPHRGAKLQDGEPRVDMSHFFLTEFPKEEAALARVHPDGYAERFEAFAHGLELCNGFAELTDSAEQRRRFEKEQEERRAAGKTIFPIDEELLEALEKIEKPIYGNALGLDRLMMLKYGMRDINSVQLFPFDERY
jgi:lysyl-tRNA synthetase class 2